MSQPNGELSVAAIAPDQLGRVSETQIALEMARILLECRGRDEVPPVQPDLGNLAMRRVLGARQDMLARRERDEVLSKR
jgi:hypothetical protein